MGDVGKWLKGVQGVKYIPMELEANARSRAPPLHSTITAGHVTPVGHVTSCLCQRVTQSWLRPVCRGFPPCFAQCPVVYVSPCCCCCSSTCLRSRRLRQEAAPCRAQVRRVSGGLAVCTLGVFPGVASEIVQTI